MSYLLTAFYCLFNWSLQLLTSNICNPYLIHFQKAAEDLRHLLENSDLVSTLNASSSVQGRNSFTWTEVFRCGVCFFRKARLFNWVMLWDFLYDCASSLKKSLVRCHSNTNQFVKCSFTIITSSIFHLIVKFPEFVSGAVRCIFIH